MWPFRKRSPWRAITPGFAVTGQIAAEDLPVIAEAGFRLLICTRPDGEEASQPGFAGLASEAARLGMDAHQIPVSGAPTPDQVARMQALLAAADGPVLGWCRSGARAELLHRLVRG